MKIVTQKPLDDLLVSKGMKSPRSITGLFCSCASSSSTRENILQKIMKNRYFELLLRLPGDAEIPRGGISSSKRPFFSSPSLMIGNIFAPDLEHDGGRDRGEAEAEQGEDEDERPHDVSWARVGPGVKRN